MLNNIKNDVFILFKKPNQKFGKIDLKNVLATIK